jgi:hypothetical protein
MIMTRNLITIAQVFKWDVHQKEKQTGMCIKIWIKCYLNFVKFSSKTIFKILKLYSELKSIIIFRIFKIGSFLRLQNRSILTITR